MWIGHGTLAAPWVAGGLATWFADPLAAVASATLITVAFHALAVLKGKSSKQAGDKYTVIYAYTVYCTHINYINP